MTPSLPDRDVIRNKLHVIDESLGILRTLPDVNARRLGDEPITRAAVERLLSRIVDQAVEINSHVASSRLGRAPGSYRESFQMAREAGAITAELSDELMPSVAMRNIIVHGYVNLDLERVAQSVPLALDQYQRYVSSVAGFLLSLDG